ncbi:MAG: hypothetical protein AAF226_09590, partial [Verrucomicrobiota bacterium]
SRLTALSFLAIGTATALTSCKDSEPESFTRTLTEKEQDVRVVESTAERFRYSSTPQTQQPVLPETESEGTLTATTPEGWKTLEARQFREVNLAFGPDNEGECYVSRLPGGAGGLAQNLNRWRKQMGQAELDADAIAALPKKALMGGQASFIEIDGTFSGMGGGGAKNDYRMLGLVGNVNGETVFVKMTGPNALVEANTAKFHTFVASLKNSGE